MARKLRGLDAQRRSPAERRKLLAANRRQPPDPPAPKRAAPSPKPRGLDAQRRSPAERRKLLAANRRQPPDSSPLRPLAVPQALAKAKVAPDKPGHKRAGLQNALSGKSFGRTLGHAISAVGEAVIDDPIDAARKTVKSAGEIAKGVGSTAIAIPYHGAKTLVDRAVPDSVLPSSKGDSTGEIVGRIAKSTAKGYGKKYGPSWRGEPGARKQLVKTVKKEGPLATALDVATVLAPGSAGIGKVGQLGARARPKLKVSPLVAATKQRQRPTAGGYAVARTHDTARRVVQGTVKARSQQRLRTRVPGVKAKHIEGRKPSIRNTEPKPLTARRAALKQDEVAPILEKAGNRTLRRSVAEDWGRGVAAANYRVDRHSTGRGPESLRTAFAPLDEADHAAAIMAAGMGIKDAASARLLLPDKLAEMQATRAAAGSGKKGKGKQGKSDAKAERRARKAGDDGEMAQVQAWLANPAVFDRADVQTAADGIRRNPVGVREGMGEQRGASGRTKLVGATIGVKTAAAKGREAKAAHAESLRAARADVDAKRATVVALQQQVASGRALTREASVGAGVTRKVALGDTATLKSIGRHDAKQVKRQRLSRVAHHAEPLVRAGTGLRVAKRELQAARVRAAQVAAVKPKAQRETPMEYAARVDAAVTDRGGVAPAFAPSKFEQEGLPGDRPAGSAASNPLGRKRSGTLHRLGREDKTLAVVEKSLTDTLKRGADKEAEANILRKHGIPFSNKDAATAAAKKMGLNIDPDMGRVDVKVHSPSSGEGPKGMVTPRKGKGSADAGDYTKTDDVVLLPTAVKEELDALNLQASTPANALKKLAHYPQTVLLALNPSWFQFQRVNDLTAATLGGSALSAVALRNTRKGLDEDSREILHIVAGGGMSSEHLSPHSARKLGRLQRVLDENPVYQKAFGGKNPALFLLTHDRNITGAVREQQLLHNLLSAARKMDPNVSAVSRVFGPIGHAFKTGDIELAQKLLKDPRYRGQLEDAAQRLYQIHGDWHNFTARERQLKHFPAFYGFLRYATRMALFTLPVQHPHVGLLVGQLGAMGAADAKNIVGPDLPYGLGALYNADGTIAADFARANPLTGPLVSITKPQHLASVTTPLAGILLNFVAGHNVAMSDPAEGWIAQYTVKGNKNDHAVGPTELGRITADQVLSLLGPYREWDKFDGRKQSSDSLPFDRRHLVSQAKDPMVQVKLDEENREARKSDGLPGLLHGVAPLLAPGSAKNMQAIGKKRTAGKAKAAERKAKAAASLAARNTPAGQMDRRVAMIEAKIAEAEGPSRARIAAIERGIELLAARRGAP